MSNNIYTLNNYDQESNNVNQMRQNRDSHQNIESNQRSGVFRTVCPYLKIISFSSFVIILNTLIFGIELAINYKYTQNWDCTLYNMGAKFTPAIQHDFQLYRFITPIFLHASFSHLLMNTVSLLFLSPFAEHFLGTTRFSLIYMISGIYASLLSTVINTDSLSVGASGSIMGLSGFYFVFYIQNFRALSEFDKKFFFVFAMITIVNIFQFSKSQVDVFGHLGGFLGGVFLSMVLATNILTRNDNVNLMKKLKVISLNILIISGFTMVAVIFMMKVQNNNLSADC